MNIFYFLFFILFSACTKKDNSTPQKHEHQEKQKASYTCPMHPQINSDQPGKCSICNMDLVKKEDNKANLEEKVYKCPMHPQVVSNKPDQCNICGMDLVLDETKKVKQSSHQVSGHATIHLDHKRNQMIGVKTGKVEKKNIFKHIRVAGRLAYDPDLYAAQGEYLEALKQYDSVKSSSFPEVIKSSQTMLEAAKTRLKVLGLSDRHIKEIENSPHGKDTSLLIGKEGNQSWVYADIYEMDLAYVQANLPVQMKISGMGETKIKGKIVSLDRIINPTTRTAKARILIEKTDELLRPESYVDVTIVSPLGSQLVVPFTAVFDTGLESWVFVTDGTGHYEPRKVEIKFRNGNEIAIAKGLKEGEDIVTSGTFLIDSESRLHGASHD